MLRFHGYIGGRFTLLQSSFTRVILVSADCQVKWTGKIGLLGFSLFFTKLVGIFKIVTQACSFWIDILSVLFEDSISKVRGSI